MKIAYLDCFSGISGDMMLGALVDLGFSESVLREGLSCLPVGGYRIEVSRQKRQGLEGTRVEVILEEEKQPCRDYAAIRGLISESTLPERVRRMAGDIFERVARAEARVHGVALDKVHFHEVGAVDSIVDIVGVALGLDSLGIEKGYVSPLPLGSGFVRCSHGTLPVPAPATVEILADMRVKDHPTAGFELVTPTGAAIAACLAAPDHPWLPPLRLRKVGYGVGSRDHDTYPNLLRVYMGDEAGGYDEDEVLVLECQMDDLQPEIYPYLMEKLLQAGARDACLVPVQMKKGRAGMLVQVLADAVDQDNIVELLFAETTTLGVRISRTRRVKLPRRLGEVDTAYGKVPVKIVENPCLDGMEVRPEYEACKQVATKRGVPLRNVYDAVIRSGSSHEGRGEQKSTKKEQG